MTGQWAVLEALRANEATKNTPVVIMTGYSNVRHLEMLPRVKVLVKVRPTIRTSPRRSRSCNVPDNDESFMGGWSAT